MVEFWIFHFSIFFSRVLILQCANTAQPSVDNPWGPMTEQCEQSTNLVHSPRADQLARVSRELYSHLVLIGEFELERPLRLHLGSVLHLPQSVDSLFNVRENDDVVLHAEVDALHCQRV